MLARSVALTPLNRDVLHDRKDRAIGHRLELSGTKQDVRPRTRSRVLQVAAGKNSAAQESQVVFATLVS